MAERKVVFHAQPGSAAVVRVSVTSSDEPFRVARQPRESQSHRPIYEVCGESCPAKFVTSNAADQTGSLGGANG